jgi:UDP-glucuronate 4-epimerase
MVKILVTGIAGFIGSNLGEHLIKGDVKLIGIDNFDPFYDRQVKENNLNILNRSSNFIFFEGDICNVSFLNTILNNEKPDLVIHLAAKAGVRPSILNPSEYYNTNVIGTLNLLEAMKTAGCKRMIFGSSSSIYGNNKKVPFSEKDNVDNPISPYAATKKAGELLCHTYHHLYNFDINCLRFFTVYGPRQRPDLAIHKFTRYILEGKPLPFYGDGDTARDYTYIDDILHGIMHAVDNLNGFNIINLGESNTITLSKLVSVLETEIGKKAILEKLPMQPGDVEITYADISKAKQLIGYNPTFSFEDGIKEFVKWFKNNYQH